MSFVFFEVLPFAPTRPSATEITADWITITWQPGGGPPVDSFTLYYRAKSASQWIVIKSIKGRDSMTLSNLQPFTTYQFRVFAVNNIGTSKPSPLAEFTTSQKGLQMCIVYIMYLNQYQYIPNQWIVFFARSDWLLKLAIVSAIRLPPFFRFSCASFSSFLR